MMDMFTGAIVASWLHIIAQRVTRPIDQWLAFPPRPVVVLSDNIAKKEKASPPVVSHSLSAQAPTSPPSSEYHPSPVTVDLESSFCRDDHTMMIGDSKLYRKSNFKIFGFDYFLY